MLLTLAFLAAPPPTFVQAVDQRLAGTQLQVAHWWSDDLDGDHVPEAIAEVCDETTGFFIVQHGTRLLVAPKEIDGRNHCEAAAQRPAWEVRAQGVIEDVVDVHHGQDTYRYAIRGGALAMVRMASSGFDVVRDGRDEEDNVEDYDTLTWTRVRTPAKSFTERTTGPIVLAARAPHRAAKLFGATTVTASAKAPSGPIVLHIRADRTLLVHDCREPDTSCNPKRVAKGTTDFELANTTEIKITAGKQRRELHVVTLDADASYPPPPTPW